MSPEYPLVPGAEVTVEPFCDYHQAICTDELTEVGAEDAWDEESVRAGLALWDGGFAVGTERGWDTILFTFALVDDPPEADFGAWDHIVEGGVRLQSGRLVVKGPSDDYGRSPRLLLSPGEYSLIVLAADLASVDRSSRSMDGSDHYRVVLWPGPVLPRRVLRQGLRSR